VADPNSLWFYLAVSSGLLLLYLLVFRIMHEVFKRRFRRRTGETGAPSERRRRGVLITLVVASVALLASFLWMMPVVFIGLPTFSYLL
jgi:ABC-type Fe3+ transport system permease subunit